jgi:hypothetical protein
VEIVTLSKAYWKQRFDGARRLVGAIPDLIPSAKAGTAPIDALASDAREAATAMSPEALLP